MSFGLVLNYDYPLEDYNFYLDGYDIPRPYYSMNYFNKQDYMGTEQLEDLLSYKWNNVYISPIDNSFTDEEKLSFFYDYLQEASALDTLNIVFIDGFNLIKELMGDYEISYLEDLANQYGNIDYVIHGRSIIFRRVNNPYGM